jgi:hypothetical protein
MFSDPPREYSSAPLWVWNDMMTDEEVAGTLRDLAGQGTRQVFTHQAWRGNQLQRVLPGSQNF